MLLVLSGIIFSCSKQESTETINDIEIDFSKIIDSETTLPNVNFDGSVKGLYKGVFVSANIEHHGVLSINFMNDGNLNAIVDFSDGTKLGFIGKEVASNRYTYYSKKAQFDFVISSDDVVTIENASIAELYVNSKVVKDISTNRTLVGLGTFVDTSDPAFGGTWDFISTASTVISVPFPPFPDVTFPADLITEVVVCYDDGTPTGRLFSDTSMEVFTGGPSCQFLPPTPLAPFFTGPIVINLPIIGATPVDEWGAFNQTSVFGNHTSSWSLGYSLAAGGPGQVYIDSDCNVIPAGTWSWNSRSGTISFY